VLRFVRRRPLTCYFGLVYLLSGLALLVIGLPKLHSTKSRSMRPLVMFPVIVIGIGLTRIALTAATGGRKRLQEPRAQHAPTGDPARPRVGLPAFQALAESISRCQQAGLARAGDDPHWLAAQVRAALHGLVLLRLNAPGFPGPAHSSRWPTRLWPTSSFSTPRRIGTPPDRHYKENCHASQPRFP
jgi:hypothetical protein